MVEERGRTDRGFTTRVDTVLTYRASPRGPTNGFIVNGARAGSAGADQPHSRGVLDLEQSVRTLDNIACMYDMHATVRRALTPELDNHPEPMEEVRVPEGWRSGICPLISWGNSEERVPVCSGTGCMSRSVGAHADLGSR